MPPWLKTFPITSPKRQLRLPTSRIQDCGLSVPPISSYSATTTLSGIQTDWKNAYMQSWNFTVQQQLSENSRFQVVYVGNHTNHLPSPTENINRYFTGTPLRPYPAWGNIAVETAPCRINLRCAASQLQPPPRRHGLIVNVELHLLARLGRYAGRHIRGPPGRQEPDARLWQR